MHSISVVRSSSGAANYFAADNYYTAEENAEAGIWAGEGSARLGLEGPVDKDTFEKILNGELPDGTKVGQVENRRLGLDLTFSMPKSASIMAYVAGDKRILDANLRAVEKTMKYVERNHAEARNYERNPNGEAEKTGNLVYALFAHDTSRALDPQGHIHAVVANLTETLDGKWKALWNQEIWNNNTTIGQVYHAALRAELEKLGYELEAAGKHGTFEVKGVPKDLRDEFSSRTKLIETEIAARGVTRYDTMKEITLYTRDPKVGVTDRDQLTQDWKDRAAARGFDGQALKDEALQRSQQAQSSPIRESFKSVMDEMRTRFAALTSNRDELLTGGVRALSLSASEIRAEHATASAIRHLSEREAAYSKESIKASALNLQVKGVEVELVEARIGQLLAQGQLIPGKSDRIDGHATLVTTPAALRMEQTILDRIEASADKGRVFLPPEVAAERLQEAARALGEARAGQQQQGWQLNEGQLAAGIAVLSGRERYLNIQGVAGAGKSTLLGALDIVFKEEGVRLVGLAFQNKMVADLRGGGGQNMSVEDMQKRGIEAYTIASFAAKYERAAFAPNSAAGVAAKAELANTVLITDEASMVSSRDMLRLTGIVDRLGIDKAPFMGDRQQLSAIEQGKMFAVSQASGHATVRMDENIRQRNSPLLMAVAGLSNEGHASMALDILNAHGRVTQAGANHIEATANMWLALSPDTRERTAIFTAGRDDRNQINLLVQEGLKAEGELTGPGYQTRVLQSTNNTREELRFPSTYLPGRTLEARMAVRELGLEKGEFTVAAINKDGTVTLTKDGKTRTIDPQKIQSNHRFDRMSLHDRKDITLHSGDTIFWRDKDKALDIAKSTYSKVLSADATGITVELPDKRAIMLPAGHPMLERLDLGYALNAHMVQGMTKPEAIEHISERQTNLATQRTQHVLNTRATDDMHVVTDNLDGLKRQLDRNPGNKTSAKETVGDLTVDKQPTNPTDVRRLPELHISPELQAKLDALKPAPANSLPVPEKTLGLEL